MEFVVVCVGGQPIGPELEQAVMHDGRAHARGEGWTDERIGARELSLKDEEKQCHTFDARRKGGAAARGCVRVLVDWVIGLSADKQYTAHSNHYLID